MYRGEALYLARRFEASHHFLTHPRRLMQVFGAFIEPFVLAVLERVGLGFELHIYKHIVEQHGGDTTLDNTEGANNIFTVSLPTTTANDS